MLATIVAQAGRGNLFVLALGRLLSSRQFSTTLFLVALAVGTARILHVRGLTFGQIGIAYVAVATAALSLTGSASIGFLGGIALLLLGGWLHVRLRVPGAAVMVIGAALFSYGSGIPARPLFQLALIAFIPVAGLALADFALRRPALASGMTAITILGVFVTVPDTSSALVLLVATLVLFPGVMPRGTELGGIAAPTLVGLLVWVAVEGGITRPGSVVGAMAGLGLLILEPLLVRITNQTPPWSVITGPHDGRILIAAQSVLVFLTSRIAGFQQRSEPALALGMLAWAVGAALILTKSSRSEQTDQRASEMP